MKINLTNLILQELRHVNLNIMTLISLIKDSKNSTGQSLPANRLIKLPQWNDYHEYPSIGSLRNMIYNREFNGFGICIKRVGKNIFIDEGKFFEWMKTNPTLAPKRERVNKKSTSQSAGE